MRFKVRYLLLPVLLFSSTAYGSTGLYHAGTLQTDEQAQLSDSDLKKLRTADGIEEKANEMVGDCGGPIQSMDIESLDESDAIKQSSRKYSSKCVRKRLSALELYFSANDLRNKVYRKNIKAFLNEFEGNTNQLVKGKLLDEESLEFINHAGDLRSGAAKKRDDNEKMFLLEQALTYERIGIDKMRQAWLYYSNWPVEYIDEEISVPAITQSTPDSYTPLNQEVSTEIQINTKQLERFNAFMDSAGFSGDYTYDNSVVSLRGFDVESLKAAWYAYVNNTMPEFPVEEPETYLADTEQKDSVVLLSDLTDTGTNTTGTGTQTVRNNAAMVPGGTSTTTSEKTNLTDKGEPKQVTGGTSTSKQTQTKQINPTGTTEHTNVSTLPVLESRDAASSGLVYRVQIAANPSLLSQGTLRKIYMGNKQIGVVNENGWNKYSIGNFPTFEEADQFRKQSGVRGAFVVAYQNDIKVDIAKQTFIEPGPGVVEPGASSGSADIEFSVQISASRNPMPEASMNRLYAGAEEITERYEDNWYKYTIGRERSLMAAQSIKSGCGVDDAFVVVYADGKRIRLTDLGKGAYGSTGRNTNATTGTKSYKVQIAASLKPIPENRLQSVYAGPHEITVQKEGAWYRYTIGDETTYAAARAIALSTGIQGSFVATYQNGVRIFPPATAGTGRAVPVTIIPGTVNQNGTAYYVQVSASRQKVNASQLGMILLSGYELLEFYEDGWYKYRIAAGVSLQRAQEIKQECGVRGAFVLVFVNGTKSSLRRAGN